MVTKTGSRIAARGWQIAVALALLLVSVAAFAGGSTTIGNGDDGADLEGVLPLTDGPIVEARAKAIALLDRLDTASIRGLGALLPEVLGSALYRVKEDKPASLSTDQGAFHGDLTGRVYARTIAAPHAATRFFPAAETLSPDQLVALHIHEGLHRALPAPVREDEAVVSRLTLAIVSPASTHDQVRELAATVLPERDLRMTAPGGYAYGAAPSESVTEGHYKQPSNIGYAVRQFWKGDQVQTFAVTRMHVLHSDLYPFGGANTPFGFGIEGSFVETASQGPQVGPLSLSARLRIWSRRDFDFGLWGVASLNTLSNEELKHSPFGRDVFTIGTSMRKVLSRLYVENYLSLNFAGESQQLLNRVWMRYRYGEVLNAKIRAGARFGGLDVGGFAEIHLANYFRVDGGAFTFDTGRYRILSVGPEVTFTTPDYSVSFFSRFLVNATQGASFDYLGNLMGTGVGQGSVGLSASVFF